MVSTLFSGNNTYRDYLEFLGQKGNRKLAHNTYVWNNKGDIIISLHNHHIIIYHKDGSVTIDTCGYSTVTTKQRLNQFSPIDVRQKNWEWYANGELWEHGTFTLPAPRRWYSNHNAPGYLPDNEAIEWGEYQYERDILPDVQAWYADLYPELTFVWYNADDGLYTNDDPLQVYIEGHGQEIVAFLWSE